MNTDGNAQDVVSDLSPIALNVPELYAQVMKDMMDTSQPAISPQPLPDYLDLSAPVAAPKPDLVAQNTAPSPSVRTASDSGKPAAQEQAHPLPSSESSALSTRHVESKSVQHVSAMQHFTQSADNRTKLESGLKVLSQYDSIQPDKLTLRQKQEIDTVVKWMKTNGEALVYGDLHAAEHAQPAALYARAVQYGQFVSRFLTEGDIKADAALQRRIEYAGDVIDRGAKSQIEVDLDKLRRENGGKVTQEALAKTVAHQLGFTDDDMKLFARSLGTADVNGLFARPLNDGEKADEWAASLQTQKSVKLWEMQWGMFNYLKDWAKGMHALQTALPQAEESLKTAQKDLTTEEYTKQRRQLDELQLKAQGKLPLFSAQGEDDPRVRTLVDAIQKNGLLADYSHLQDKVGQALSYVTRPWAILGTAISGAQLTTGAILSGDFAAAKEYAFGLPDAVKYTAVSGGTPDKYLCPVEQVFDASVDDPNSAKNKTIGGILGAVFNPANYVGPDLIKDMYLKVQPPVASTVASTVIDSAQSLHVPAELPARPSSIDSLGAVNAPAARAAEEQPVRSTMPKTGPLVGDELDRFFVLSKKYAESQLTPAEAKELSDMNAGQRIKPMQEIDLARQQARAVDTPADVSESTSYRPDPFRLHMSDMTQFESITRSVEKFDTLKAGAADSSYQNWSEFERNAVDSADRPARVYKLKDTDTTISLPEDLAQRLDVVRRLRVEALKQPTGDAAELARIHQAQAELANNPLQYAVLPEEMAALINELPNKSLVKHVQLLDHASAYDVFHSQQKNETFVSAADANINDGIVHFYESGLNRPDQVRSVLFHEWSHLAERASQSLEVFKHAGELEPEWHSRPYATTDYHENWAVHLGEEMLKNDGANYQSLAQNAPLRTVAMAEELKAQLGTNPNSVAGSEHWVERLNNVENYVVSDAKVKLRDILASGNEAQQLHALDYIMELRKVNPYTALRLVEVDNLTELARATDNPSIASKATELIVESFKAHPQELIEKLHRISDNPSANAALPAKVYLMAEELNKVISLDARNQSLDLLAARGHNGSNFWVYEVLESMNGLDDRSQLAVMEHAFELTPASLRARLLRQILDDVKPEFRGAVEEHAKRFMSAQP